jgi:hypothetical protein
MLWDTPKKILRFSFVINVRETSGLLLGRITMMGLYGSLSVIQNSFLILTNGMSKLSKSKFWLPSSENSFPKI